MPKFKLVHQEISVTPFTLGIVHRGFHHKLQLKYTKPDYFKNSVIVYKNMACDWYCDHPNFINLGIKVINLTQEDIHFKDRLLNHTLKIGKSLFQESKKVDQANLGKYSNQQLAKSLAKIYSIGNDLCDVGMVAAVPDVHFNTFTHVLKKVIQEKIQEHKLKKTLSEYFSILVSPTQPSYVAQESLKILEFAIDINKSQGLRKIFKNQAADDILDILKNKYKEVYKKIDRIHDAYRWLSFGQLGPVKTLEEYVEDIKNVLHEGKIQAKIQEIKDDPKHLKQKQTQYIKELKLDKSEKHLFTAAQNYSYNKAFRYDMLLYAYFALDKILRQASKRIELSVQEMRFCSPEEISNLLLSKKGPSRKEIKERQNLCVVIIRNKGAAHLIGEKAKQFIKTKIQIPKIKKDITCIHGTAAYLGRVEGTVKIVDSPKDMDKIEPGDILVSIQTTPDLVPAMKKASVFVTDIGGITSHAAIVAREMKKPCIIGTKFASKVLKDGDRIEVNANEGDVMKLKIE